MARRKVHVQQVIRWPNAAGDLRGRKREAGKGRGRSRIGRPKKAGAKHPHDTRPEIGRDTALHVTLRVDRVVKGLRTRACYRAVREAAVTLLPREDCRIMQLSIQGTHLHLIVEADSKRALATGMQAFSISAAKHINAAVSRAGSWWERRRMRESMSVSESRGARSRGAPSRGAQWRGAQWRGALPKRRKGRVFSDRYHARIITSPQQARRELAYVLNNWRKHGEDRRGDARTWLVDPFSTGCGFMGWRERADAPFAWKLPPTYEAIPVHAPRSWLLRAGWRRCGLISTHEVPGSR
ncbi:MAG TPA: hypothetical protein VLT45_16970 [Kofleriaceae bacterium]|nr:hypothetical protein [Kofleriaceae bacterium]